MTRGGGNESFQYGYAGKRLADIVFLLLTAPLTIPLMGIVAA